MSIPLISDQLALVLDCSGPRGAVGLFRQELLEQRTWGGGQRAGNRLAPAVAELFEMQGLSAKDLELIILANGPGSFTGLRVGLATAKGLAFANDTPLVALSTLDILGQQAPLIQGVVTAVMPARRGEVFRADYGRQDFFCQRQNDYHVQKEDEFLDQIGEDRLVIGPACQSLKILARKRDQGVRFAETPCNQLSLDWMNRMGQDRFRLNGAEDSASLEPWYLQDFKPTRGKIKL